MASKQSDHLQNLLTRKRELQRTLENLEEDIKISTERLQIEQEAERHVQRLLELQAIDTIEKRAKKKQEDDEKRKENEERRRKEDKDRPVWAPTAQWLADHDL